MPGTGRLTPPGIGPSGSAGTGSLIEARLASTSLAAVNSRETPPEAMATAPIASAESRKVRRPEPSVRGAAYGQQPAQCGQPDGQADQGRDGVDRPGVRAA